MKKVFYAIMALATLTFASCEKEQPGGTAVEAMSGQWYVQVDGVDAETGEVVAEDFNDGRILILTYNTPSNDPNKLYINDRDGFWSFIVKVDCDLNTLTFKGEAENESYEGCVVTVTNGKIVKKGIKTPSGTDADYIQFDVNFSDDDIYLMYGEGYEDYAGLSLGDLYGFTAYRVSGWRYTGLAADE